MQHNTCIQGLNYSTHNLEDAIVTKLPNQEENENQGILRKAGKI